MMTKFKCGNCGPYYLNEASTKIRAAVKRLVRTNPSAGKRDRFLLLTDEQAPSLKLAEGRCRRQRPEAVTRP